MGFLSLVETNGVGVGKELVGAFQLFSVTTSLHSIQ